MSSKFMVLDVEGYSACRPYDIGYKISDKNGVSYAEKSFAIMPAVFDNMCYKADMQAVKGLAGAHEMAHKNIEEILNDSKNKYNKIFDIESFYFEFLRDIQEHNIKRVWAYNCSFDKSALARLFGSKFDIIENMVTFCDIIPAILYTKLLNKEYVEFCKSNNFVTPKGNIQTKAETVYKYLTGNTNFEEEHTGLADVQIETEILLIAMRETKNPKRKPCQAWKVIKEFCVVNDIELPIPTNSEN